MALETLNGVKTIDGFEVGRCNEDMGIPIPNYLSDKSRPIWIDDTANIVSFRIQKGPIKEVGVNGCQIDSLLETAKLIIEGFNKNFPCRENSIALNKLDEAIFWLKKRKADREARGVEGQSKA